MLRRNIVIVNTSKLTLRSYFLSIKIKGSPHKETAEQLYVANIHMKTSNPTVTHMATPNKVMDDHQKKCIQRVEVSLASGNELT